MKRFVTVVCIFMFFSVGTGLFRLNQLNQIPIHVDNFSTLNLIEIYLLGIVMSAIAYPIYPEIAVEHMSLYSKQKKDRESDFFMNSKVVRNAIENYQSPKLLVWSSNDYMIGKNEARVALALNGATLSKDGKKVSIQVPIKYPRNSLVKLVPGIEVQEGLFWILQQKGWYHTGTMTWTHKLNSED